MPKQTYCLTVIVRPAQGRLKDFGAITSQNVAEAAPAPAAVKQVQEYFAAQKCKIHSGVANSFTIEAGLDVFAKIFDKKEIERLEPKGGELSLAKLPADVEKLLEAVAFSAPPDFGPGNFA